MGTTLVKGKRMDQHTTSAQVWEIAYIAKKFSVRPAVVRWARKQIKSKSRKLLYNFLRTLPKQ